MNEINYDDLVDHKPDNQTLCDLVRDPAFFELPDDIRPRDQSKKIDKILGFKIPKIEQGLLKKYKAYYKLADETDRKQNFGGTQTWIGLHPQVLQTPYSEILDFFLILKKYRPKSIIDLGAGYGRVGIVMNSLMQETSFLGYEIMDVRLNEARRIFESLKLTNCEMVQKNILDNDFKLPSADIYFIYDFSDPMDVRKILSQLSNKLYKERFFIVAKGEGIRSLIQLKFPEFWASHGAIHRKNWSLYSSFCDL